MRRVLSGLAVLGLLLMPSKASADPIDLYQWMFNLDGTIYDSLGLDGSSTLPGAFSLTPSATGAQGLLQVTVTGTGAHSFLAFYDYELDETANGFSNETASVSGAPQAGLSWEIDEPGFVFGDIYTNLLAGAFDNTNNLPGAEDVSVGLGWNFLLGAGETALISLLVSTVAPAAGFFITHMDPTGTALYYSTSLAITGGPPSQVPESGSLVVLALGLVMLVASRRWRQGLRSQPRLG
jgi:hypothetical protein